MNTGTIDRISSQCNAVPCIRTAGTWVKTCVQCAHDRACYDKKKSIKLCLHFACTPPRSQHSLGLRSKQEPRFLPPPLARPIPTQGGEIHRWGGGRGVAHTRGTERGGKGPPPPLHPMSWCMVTHPQHLQRLVKQFHDWQLSSSAGLCAQRPQPRGQQRLQAVDKRRHNLLHDGHRLGGSITHTRTTRGGSLNTKPHTHGSTHSCAQVWQVAGEGVQGLLTCASSTTCSSRAAHWPASGKASAALLSVSTVALLESTPWASNTVPSSLNAICGAGPGPRRGKQQRRVNTCTQEHRSILSAHAVEACDRRTQTGAAGCSEGLGWWCESLERRGRHSII